MCSLSPVGGRGAYKYQCAVYDISWELTIPHKLLKSETTACFFFFFKKNVCFFKKRHGNERKPPQNWLIPSFQRFFTWQHEQHEESSQACLILSVPEFCSVRRLSKKVRELRRAAPQPTRACEETPAEEVGTVFRNCRCGYLYKAQDSESLERTIHNSSASSVILASEFGSWPLCFLSDYCTGKWNNKQLLRVVLFLQLWVTSEITQHSTFIN